MSVSQNPREFHASYSPGRTLVCAYTYWRYYYLLLFEFFTPALADVSSSLQDSSRYSSRLQQYCTLNGPHLSTFDQPGQQNPQFGKFSLFLLIITRSSRLAEIW